MGQVRLFQPGARSAPPPLPRNAWIADAVGHNPTGRAPHPPRLARDAALFLDFDGTLAEFAPGPDGVKVDRQLPQLLRDVAEYVTGALAMVTGRPLADLDRLLGRLPLAGAGQHGAELRLAPGAAPRLSGAEHLHVLASELRTRFAGDSRIEVEDRDQAVAVHFRQSPQRATQCLSVINQMVRRFDDLDVVRGNLVIEARPRGTDKGLAVRRFMDHAPFRGRRPVYVGDDASDEDGFRAAHVYGGYGVRVGSGHSRAEYRCTGVAALHRWLSGSVHRH